jgi:hypothetical protein
MMLKKKKNVAPPYGLAERVEEGMEKPTKRRQGGAAAPYGAGWW